MYPKPIKLLIDRDTIVGRLERATDFLDDAIDNDDDKIKVQEAMANLYWKYIDPPPGSNSKAAYAHSLRRNSSLVGVAGGALGLGASGTSPFKSTRSYGSERS